MDYKSKIEYFESMDSQKILYNSFDAIFEIKQKHLSWKSIFRIHKNMGWCDDPRSTKYNQLIKLPNQYKYEKFYRDDHLYDLILVLNYNMKPVIKNKGSAIFIHIAKKNYKPTAGCVALKKKDLIKLLGIIKRNTRIYIN